MSGLNDINDIPKAWRSALASVKLSYPEAVIAGGALRDREHGVKVKDIDIFVNDKTCSADIIRKLRATGWADIQLNGDDSYGDGASERQIVAVLDLKYPGCPDIQLIAMRQFKLEEIDFGICQIAFDGTRIIRTPDYHLDMQAKQFRLIPKVADAMFVRSLARWARLKEKYPEWKLHLGSRAETDPFVPPKKPLVFQHMDMPGVTSMEQARRRAGFHRGGPITAYLDVSSRPDISVLMHSAGDYVVPKAVAERLAKETTAQITNFRSDAMVTVKVDERALTPSRKIIQEMVEAHERLMSGHRRSALLGQP